MTVAAGFDEDERTRVAALYWAAFGGKLGRVLGPADRARHFVARVADPDHALTYRDADGRIVGVAGFKTPAGAFVGGTRADLAAIYGWRGALWRHGLLALLERDSEDRRFLMDGLCVCEEARGRGIGTALLEGIAREAARRGYAEVRLDVVEDNHRARALYERRGFESVDRQPTGPLRHVFGFAAATTMVRRLA